MLPGIVFYRVSGIKVRVFEIFNTFDFYLKKQLCQKKYWIK
jgi:hypothetical protein